MREAAKTIALIAAVIVGAYLFVALMIFLTPLMGHLLDRSGAWWAQRLGKG